MVVNKYDSISVDRELVETLNKLGIEKDSAIRSIKILLTTDMIKNEFISLIKEKEYKLDVPVIEIVNKLVEKYAYKEYRLKNHLILRSNIFSYGLHQLSAYSEAAVELVYGDVKKKGYGPVFNYLKGQFINPKASIGIRNMCENPVLDDDAILIIEDNGEIYYWLIDYSRKASIKKIEIVKASDYNNMITPYEDFMKDMFFRYEALPDSISFEVMGYIKSYIKNNAQN